MTYPEYTIRLEAENKRLKEVNAELLEIALETKRILYAMSTQSSTWREALDLLTEVWEETITKVTPSPEDNIERARRLAGGHDGN